MLLKCTWLRWSLIGAMLVLSFLAMGLIFLVETEQIRPNIVIIMADDMGSYDASFRGSDQILTPNIDALAYHGVILDRFYTPSMCTPSRSSVMTGKYPHSIGMQNWVIQADEPWGLGLNEKLMSNYFQEAGYKTHLIGKWHLGFFQKEYTPTFRGFDTFFGYYNGLIDYYKFSYVQPPFVGYDFRVNTKVNYDVKPGSYATDLFTNEAVKLIKNHDEEKPLFLMLNHLAPHTGNEYELLQAPKEEIERFENITDPDRRILAAMISKLDESVGEVIGALEEKGILDETIIMFYSDNGAPTAGLFDNSGSNHPLKGQKFSPWEGASRTLGVIYSRLMKQKQRVYDGYFHTSDVLPTLASIAGIEIGKVDGFNQWNSLINGDDSPRNEVVTHLDEVFQYYGYISDNWKIVKGTTLNGKYDDYLGAISEVSLPPEFYADVVLTSKVGKILRNEKLSQENILSLRKRSKISCNENANPVVICKPLEAPCIFDIQSDPCERNNLAVLLPDVLKLMNEKLGNIIQGAKPSRRIFGADRDCDPKKFNGTWTWYKELENNEFLR